MPELTAKQFVEKLSATQSKAEAEKVQRYCYDKDNKENKCLGVRFGTIFKLAKDFKDMPLKEVEKLLDNKFYEVRMGAVSIMDFQAREKKITPEQKKEVFD